jgi:hypothetical protein
MRVLQGKRCHIACGDRFGFRRLLLQLAELSRVNVPWEAFIGRGVKHPPVTSLESFPHQIWFQKVKKQGRHAAGGDHMGASIVPRLRTVTVDAVVVTLLLSTPAAAVDSEAQGGD